MQKIGYKRRVSNLLRQPNTIIINLNGVLGVYNHSRAPFSDYKLEETKRKWCGRRDLNPRTTKDKTLNLAPLTELGNPRAQTSNTILLIKFFTCYFKVHLASSAWFTPFVAWTLSVNSFISNGLPWTMMTSRQVCSSSRTCDALWIRL